VVRRFAFAFPGELSTPTGGYAYDRRMVAELTRAGWHVDLVGLGDGFPLPDEHALQDAHRRLMDIPEGRTIVVDGLALGVLPDAAKQIGGNHPLVALVHHPLALESGLSHEQVARLHDSERAALASAAHIVTTSATTARLLAANYGVDASRISVAPPGTDPAPPSRRAEDGIVRLLAVGAIVPRKGYDTLIAALAAIPDLPWRLEIVGDRTRDPTSAAQLDSDIAGLGLTGKVSVLGAVSAARLEEAFRSADVFVLASRFEGYGMAYAEALAHGLPIIGTHAGAIPETVPPAAALLGAPDDVQGLAQAFREIIGNPQRRQQLAAAARMAAGDLPTWEHSAKIFADVLRRVA
jgi:glycosyltransferase involved in cell wall biosynthesis